MSNQSSLTAATQDRKARLAQLKSLKRKKPASEDDAGEDGAEPAGINAKDDGSINGALKLSGRNYDSEIRDVKLGYEQNPAQGHATLEAQAKKIAEETREKNAADGEDDKPLDLFKLQPKKPNWDLKRDLERKLEILNPRTDNAIARLVRERIANAQKQAQGEAKGAENGDLAGIEGAALVGAMHEREREAQLDAEREAEEDDADTT